MYKIYLLIGFMTISNLIMLGNRREHFSNKELIEVLKTKLGSLYAKEIMLKETFKMNQEKWLFISSIGWVNLYCSLGRIIENGISRRTSDCISYSYMGIIFFYFWMRIVRYIFLTNDIKVLEHEIEELQSVAYEYDLKIIEEEILSLQSTATC